MCKALNDAKRLAILYALRTGPHAVTQLCLPFRRRSQTPPGIWPPCATAG
jgi:hypothetical protein